MKDKDLRAELEGLYGESPEKKEQLERMALTSSLRDMTTGEGVRRLHDKVEDIITSNPQHLYSYLSEDEEGNDNRGEALRNNIKQNYEAGDDGAFVRTKYDTAKKMVDKLPSSNDVGDIEIGGYIYPRAKVVKAMADMVEETMHPTLMQNNKAYRDNYSITNYGKNFGDYLKDRLVALDALLEGMQKDVNRYVKEDTDAVKDMVPTPVRAGANGIDPTIAMAIVTNEKSGGNAIRNTRDKIRSIIDNDFGSGFNESFDWGSMASLGVNDIIAGAELNGVLNKAKEGKELSEREQTVYDVWTINQELDGIREMTGRSGWNNIGSGVGFSAEFAPSMLLGTGLLSGGVKLTSLGIKAGIQATRKAMQKGVINGIKRGLIETAKVGGRSAANVARAEAVGLISAPITPTTWARYAEKRNEQYRLNGDSVEYAPTEVWKDVSDVMIEQANEVASELVGGRIADVIGSSAKAFGRTLRLDRIADKVGIGSGTRTFFGLRKPAYIREFERNIGFAGSIAEPLSEVWGDVSANIMKGAITGDSDFSQLATADYWTQVLGVSTIYGGAVSLSTTPLTVAQYKQSGIYGVAKARNKALSQIGDNELHDKMLSISSIDDINEAARELANVSWKSYSRKDVASAMDFIRADYMEKVMLGDAKENVRMSQFEPIALSTSSLVYCGEDGATPTDEIISIDTDMGRFMVRSGIIDAASDNILECVDADGNIIPVHASKIQGVYKHSLQEELANSYEKLFSVQIEQDRQNDIIENFNTIKNPTAQDVKTAMSAMGVSERAGGEEVTLIDGRKGVVDSMMEDGSYVVAVSDAQGTQLLSVPFYDVLAEDEKIKEAQMLGYAERISSNIDELVEGEKYNIAKGEEPKSRNGITEGEAINLKDGRKGRVVAINDDGTYTIDENLENIQNDINAAILTEVDETNIARGEEVNNAAESAPINATESASDNVAATEETPIEEIEEVPTLEDGSIDYNAIKNPKTFVTHFVKAVGSREAAVKSVENLMTSTRDKVESLLKKNETLTDVNEVVRNTKTIADETARLSFYDEVMNILSPTPISEVATAETTNTEAHNENTKTTPKASKPVGIVENEYSKNLEEDLARVVDTMAKSLGLSVTFTTGLRGNAEIVGDEVRIDWENRTKAVSFLAGHEFTHRMQELSPETYAEFKQSVKDYLGEDVWNSRMVKQARTYRYNKVRYTRVLLEDECVADFAGEMVENLDVFNDYINKNNTKKNLLDRILDVLRAIRDFFFNAKVEELRSLNEAIGSLEKLIAESQAAQSKITENTSTAEPTSQSEAQQSEATYSLSEKEVSNVVLTDAEDKKLPSNRKEAFEYIPQGGISIFNGDIGANINVGRKAVKHTALHHQEDGYAIFAGIRQVVENAVKVGNIPVAKDEIGHTHSVNILYVPINVNGTQYSARLLVKELENKGVVLEELSLYNVSMHKERGSAVQPLSASDEVGGITAKPQSFYKVKELIHNSQEIDKKNLGINEITRFSLQEPIFYSNAEYAVRGIKQEKATPEQWLKMIEKNGGLKAGEDKWLGLSDWLKSKMRPSSKEKPTTISINGTEYNVKELEDDILADVKNILSENDFNDEIVGLRLVGSYARGEQREDSDIDVIVEYKGDSSEDTLFDVLNDEGNRIRIEGIDVDVNPITEGKSGTLDEWEKRNAGFTKKPNTITKDEVLQYIADNDIQIEEVSYGDVADISREEIYDSDEFAALRESLTEYDDDDNPYINREHYEELRNESYDFVDGFALDYWGEDIEVDSPAAAASYLGLTKADKEINETRLQYTTGGLTNKKEIALVVPTIEPWNTSDNIHFGDAGEGRAVAWIRFGETTDADGKRVLVIDEIQSKRHQEGREKGYKRKEDDEIINKQGAVVWEMMQKYNVSSPADLRNVISPEDAAYLEEVNNHKVGEIPEAPFEKNWAELAMKRMLRYAAENGFDKVAWTTGDQQAERYGMLRAVSKIARRDNSLVEGKRFLLVGNTVVPHKITVSDEGIIVASTIENIEGKPLSEVMGKEVALKMMQMENDTSLEDADLKIGGEGMKAFYDQMLPSFVRKYAKKWGATVGEVTMPDLEENNTMHSVDVTPAMRESVMQGQPKFSLRDAETEKIFATAKEKFGTTYDMREAGYILPDGSMLDFSGKHQVRDTDTSFLNGNRTVDHREIADIAYDFDENETGVETDMGDFLDRGAIRIDSNAGAINLNVAPTKAQKDRLKRLIERNDGYVYIDFGKGWDTEHYAEYEAARASRVLGDIDRYFDEGIKPTGNVRFSLRDVNDRFNEELDAFKAGQNISELHLGVPSPLLRACGVSASEIFITAKTLREHLKKHNLTEDEIKNLPIAINDPIMVYEWGEKAKSKIIITQIPRGEQRITVAIKMERGGRRLSVNELASVHGKDVERLMNEMLTTKSDFGQDNLKYVNKEIAMQWLGIAPPEGAASLTDAQQSIANIIQNFENPKIEPRFNLRDMPFYDDGGTNEDTAPQRGIITTKEQVKIYLRHKHLKAQQEIRKKYKMFINVATLDYNEKVAARRAKVKSLRTNAAKVDYILGEHIEDTLPYVEQAYAKIARGEIKMPWETLAKELGLKKGEKRTYAGITKGADGNTTFDSVVHQWWEEIDGYGRDIDTQDLRNALIEALYAAPSSTRALAELSKIYDTDKQAYIELTDEYERMEEEELISEDARNASELERLANDTDNVVAEYARNASFFNQLEVADATVMEIRTRLEKTKMMRNYQDKQKYYRDVIDTIAELKQSVKNIITSETVEHLNRNELRKVVDKIDKARTLGEIDTLLAEIEGVMLDALIKGQLKDTNRMLKLKLPNGLYAEEWVEKQVKEGRMSRADADAMLRDRWKGRNSAGVSVAKWVDPKTADILEALSTKMAHKLSLGKNEFSTQIEYDEVVRRIDELSDKKIASDRGNVARKDIFTEKDGIELSMLSLYEKFLGADILRKDAANIMEDRADIEQFYYGIPGKEAIRDTYLEDNQRELNDVNRQRKERLQEFNDMLLSLLREGRETLALQRKEQEAHKAMVVNMALDAIGTDPRLVKNQPTGLEKSRAIIRATVNAPYYTFQTTLKEIDHLSPNGEGRFYNYFMDSWKQSNDRFIDQHSSHTETVADRMAYILRIKGRNAADIIQTVIDKADEKPLLTITYGGKDSISGVKPETKVLTLANALYMIAMWRQDQYRNSMMYHGITAEMYRKVENAVREVGKEYITFIDWVNEILLPNTRLEYNKVHKEMFGTSMAEEKNYFPARLVGTVEKGAIDFNEAGKLPSTMTGAVINRVRNKNMIDLNVNYFKILMSHLQEMDQWSSFAPLIRDLNYLAANKTFRDSCNAHMPGVNGDRSGAGSLFYYFKTTSAIAANCYTPAKVNPVESAILSLTRGWAGANISWRFSTALKQLASSPVFMVYATDPKCIALWAKNNAITFAQQKQVLEWAMRVSPMFKKRWEGKFAGMDILESKVKENGEYSNISFWNKTKVGRGIAKFDDAISKFATDWGMTPNAFVDAMTIANGIKTIYEYEIYKWKKQNEGKEVTPEVERKALMKADIAFNATQQSNESAFISEWQHERGIMRVLSTYQNSAYGFHRLRVTAANELWNQRYNTEYKQRLVEEYGEDGVKDILRDARKVAYAQLLQGAIGEFIFVLMGAPGAVPLFRLLGGDDDEGESWDLVKGAMWSLLLNVSSGGYALGSLLNSALSGYQVKFFAAFDDLYKDVKEFISTPSLYKAIQILGVYRYGVDLQTLTNIATGVEGMIEAASYGDGGAEAVMKVLNIPRTQIDLVAGKRKEGESVQDYVVRRLRTEAIGSVPEVDEEGNIIADEEYWDKFYTPRKSYAKKYKKDFETAYRRNVITQQGSIDAYNNYLEVEEEYNEVVDAIGWTPETKPSPKKYKQIVTIGGFDEVAYRELFVLQKDVAIKAKKVENFAGTDENYYALLQQMIESKQKLINRYNEL